MMYFIGSFEYRVMFLVKIRRFNGHRKWTFCILGQWFLGKFQADRLYKSNDTYQYKCGGVKAYKWEEVLLAVAIRRSKTLYVAFRAI